jgi:hypothetical protein
LITWCGRRLILEASAGRPGTSVARDPNEAAFTRLIFKSLKIIE